ncbi:MAG: hypothetical protein H7338_10275 [Candidatus Sericytochromatia bacterium]|nr:hypothetical protein [Candidatus Sericytochromatia bacterium]
MDVFKTIMNDHRQVETVFTELLATEDEAQCRTLVTRLRDLLQPHMVAE